MDSLLVLWILLSVCLFLWCTPTHSKITPNSTVFDLCPWFNSVVLFQAFSQQLQHVVDSSHITEYACGVGCMFRFLQINSVFLALYCDRVKQSNVNKHCWLATDLWPQSSPPAWKWDNSTRRPQLPLLPDFKLLFPQAPQAQWLWLPTFKSS